MVLSVDDEREHSNGPAEQLEGCLELLGVTLAPKLASDQIRTWIQFASSWLSTMPAWRNWQTR